MAEMFDYSMTYYAVQRGSDVCSDTILLSAEAIWHAYKDRYMHIFEVRVVCHSNIRYVYERFHHFGFYADNIESVRCLSLQEICDSHLVSRDIAAVLQMSHDTLTACNTVLRHKLHYLFAFVPDEFKTMEMCKRAVRSNSANVKYVPHIFITEELCAEIIGDPRGGHLKYVPQHMRSRQICEVAVRLRGSDLLHVPRSVLTADFLRATIEYSGENLCYVPDDLKTAELCYMAVQLNNNTIKYVPYRFQTAEMFDMIKQSCAADIKNIEPYTYCNVYE
jgi:hypothetical protein